MTLLARIERLMAVRLRVQGVSMEPTIQDGSLVVISPWRYVLRSPQRFDVIAIRTNAQRTDLKRIVGLPGEEVWWVGGRIRVNGRLLREPYVASASRLEDKPQHTLRLGPQEYFVAGDNRLHSLDSRCDGPVARHAILGRMIDSLASSAS